MPTVRFSGPNNSTLFTTCCGSAVIDERNCPSCGLVISPRSHRARWDAAMGPLEKERVRRIIAAKDAVFEKNQNG